MTGRNGVLAEAINTESVANMPSPNGAATPCPEPPPPSLSSPRSSFAAPQLRRIVVLARQSFCEGGKRGPGTRPYPDATALWVPASAGMTAILLIAPSPNHGEPTTAEVEPQRRRDAEFIARARRDVLLRASASLRLSCRRRIFVRVGGEAAPPLRCHPRLRGDDKIMACRNRSLARRRNRSTLP